MKVLVFVLALLIPTAALAQGHADVVAAVKAELQSQGKDLSGSCGAFQITKRVAWRLRAEGAGLLSKPGGNNCDGFSVDYIVYPDGRGADILGDSGTANIPGWGEGTDAAEQADFRTRWRPAIDPGDTVTPPAPPPVVIVNPPTPVPPAVDLQAAILAEVQATHVELQQFRAETGHAISDALKFLGQYIAPALAAFYAAWQLQSKN